MYGRKPNLEVFHPFGCKCFVALNEKQQKRYVKTAPTGMEAVHLGYDRQTRGHWRKRGEPKGRGEGPTVEPKAVARTASLPQHVVAVGVPF